MIANTTSNLSTRLLVNLSTCQLVNLSTNHLMQLIHKVFQTHKILAKYIPPPVSVQWVLHEVTHLQVTILAEIVQYLFQILFLLTCQVAVFDKAGIEG